MAGVGEVVAELERIVGYIVAEKNIKLRTPISSVLTMQCLERWGA